MFIFLPAKKSIGSETCDCWTFTQIVIIFNQFESTEVEHETNIYRIYNYIRNFDRISSGEEYG